MRERWLSGRHRVTCCGRPALGGLPARTREDRTTVSARGCEERGGGGAGLGREGCPLLAKRDTRSCRGGGDSSISSGRRCPAAPQSRSPEEEPLPSAPRRAPLPRLSPGPACGGEGGAPRLSPDFVPPAPRSRGQAGAKPAPVCSVLCLRQCCEAASCTLLAYEITDSRSEPALTKRLAKTISGSEHNFSPIKTKQ